MWLFQPRNHYFFNNSGNVLASHAVVFRGLVLPPPHKRLLTQAPHSFPIVLLPKHPSQSPSRHCLMIIIKSNCWLQWPLMFPASFVQSLVQSWEMRELSWNIYIFSLLEWLVMAETPKKISIVNTSASCATFWHRYLLGESKSSGKCNRCSPPDRVDSRPLMGAETLEQICLFVRSATRDWLNSRK